MRLWKWLTLSNANLCITVCSEYSIRKWEANTWLCCFTQRYDGCHEDKFSRNVSTVQWNLYDFEWHEFCQTQYFCNHEWSAQLTYVGDMLSELSYLNLILQTESANCFIVGDKITAFLKKTEVCSIFWKLQLLNASSFTEIYNWKLVVSLHQL
jgi:hypothetical protein